MSTFTLTFFEAKIGELHTTSVDVKTTGSPVNMSMGGASFILQPSDKWTRVNVTLPASSEGANRTQGFYIMDLPVGQKLFFRNYKVEKGTKATVWTPSSEDQVTDWSKTDVNSFAFLKNKPTTFTTLGLTDNAGNATQPVYFSGGKPVAATAYSSASVNYATSAGTATNATNATNTTNINTLVDNSSNAARFILFSDAATGNQRAKTNTGLKYNPSSNTITATLAGNASSATNADTLDGYHASSLLKDITANYGATITSANNYPTDLLSGIHRTHVSNVEYASILTGYDYDGKY